ncbi:hypothetical protein KF840_16440 [bacterium]|nr:hypothetical protein [bacterium]
MTASAPAGALTATPTATRTPCDSSGARLDLRLAADPPAPAVGDVVDLDLEVGRPNGGLAGLPMYSLSGAAPVFAAELLEHAYPYAGHARYRLTALQAGRATLQASIHYETSHFCFGGPTFFFRSSSSEPLVIEVSAASGATPTPTATPSAMSTGHATPSSTATVTATPTATTTGSPPPTAAAAPTDTPAPTPGDTASAAPSATPGTCVGDCSGDGVVSIDELIHGIAIALGSSPLATCPALDRGGDGAVTIEDLVAALRSALDGCPASRPAF